jgi:DNA-binding transcriptional MerR regulator
MNADHNSTQRQLFLQDYAEIIPIVLDLRNQGCSLSEIANELNSRGFLTREKKPFSHVQVLRILQRVNDANSTQPGAHDSLQIAVVESQSQSTVDELKVEIYTLRTQVEQLQQEFSDLKSQLIEFKQEYQLKKTDFVQGVQDVQKDQIEPARPAKLARQIDNDTKKSVLQQANQLHAENIEMSKSEIARVLSEQFDVRFETVRDWLKKLW